MKSNLGEAFERSDIEAAASLVKVAMPDVETCRWAKIGGVVVATESERFETAVRERKAETLRSAVKL
jgi:hypothetical protein